ncbi:MAG: type II secretion system protein [Gammaproteobacteria bacterium]|nr:type II secretion system protein [Gammaproteobacteria bacterium]
MKCVSRQCSVFLKASTRVAQRGMTLFELIIVIFLFGIIGVTALPRLLGSNTFNQIVVRDQIVSVARVAQNARLGRAPISLTIQPNVDGSTLAISAAHGGTVLQTSSVDAEDVILRADINETASCASSDGATLVTNTNPLTFNFTALGELGVSGVAGSTGLVTSAARICVNGDASMSVCISASGFASIGDCDA